MGSTTNKKDPRVTSTGPSEKNTTNTHDSIGANPAQFELKLEFNPEKPATKKRKFSRKSTATEAQYERIVTMLRVGPKSTFDFRKAGIMSPASRIKELNDRYGFYIPTIDQRDLYDSEGFLHKRVAVYELIDEPKEGGQHHV